MTIVVFKRLVESGRGRYAVWLHAAGGNALRIHDKLPTFTNFNQLESSAQ